MPGLCQWGSSGCPPPLTAEVLRADCSSDTPGASVLRQRISTGGTAGATISLGRWPPTPHRDLLCPMSARSGVTVVHCGCPRAPSSGHRDGPPVFPPIAPCTSLWKHLSSFCSRTPCLHLTLHSKMPRSANSHTALYAQHWTWCLAHLQSQWLSDNWTCHFLS